MAQNQFLSKYQSLEKIGSSNNSVIYNADDKEALKVLLHDKENRHSQQCLHLKNEATLLSKLRHPNIIKGYKYATSQQHRDQKFCCLSVELADMDFFGLIEKTFPKKVDCFVVKDVIKQIVQGLQYLHSQEVSHNDIKLENILLFFDEDDEGYVNVKAKIADFGFARNQNEAQDEKEYYERWNNRSNCSLAPEILQFKKEFKAGNIAGAKIFDEKRGDLFALGILIFSAYFLRSPIKSENANNQDSYYKYLKAKQYSKFWSHPDFKYELDRLTKEMGKKEIEQMKDLIQKLLASEASERPDINQILKHSWFRN